MNKISILSLFTLLSLPVSAQESEYRYDDATQLWRHTDNAAGLGLDNSRNRGYAEFDVQHLEGDYHRVQEGGMRNQLQFNTERYQHIGQFLVGYGRFTFDMDRTKDRSWCDVMRPYNANPFFGGSSVKGKYDTQMFDLTAALSTIPIPVSGDKADQELTFGARLDYKVSDMSRLRDPRSRSQLLDYKIAPGMTYTFGAHAVGLSGSYERRKEKIPSLITVQEDPNLMYYLMTGLEQATGTVGGYKGFSREWVEHRFGGELSYGLNKGMMKSLNTIKVSRGTEDAWGTYKYEPGKYVSYRYDFTSRNRINNGKTLHEIDLGIGYQEGYADEYRQQLIQERNADNGYTSFRYETLIEFRKRYQVKRFDGNFRYRCSFVEEHTVNGYFGLNAALRNTQNKHLLPTSTLEHGALEVNLEGGKALIGKHLWIDALAGYHKSNKADIALADATTDYAVNVLLPDMQYYDANYWRYRLQLTYQFPLKIKGTTSDWYVRAYYDGLSAQHDLSRSTIGFTFGIFN